MYRKVRAFLGEAYPPGSLFAAVHEFLREKEPDVSKATLIHLYRSLEQHGRFLGNCPLANVSLDLVHDFVEELRTRYSPGTIGPVVGDLKQFYAWAYHTGYTDGDYGRRLKKPRPVKGKHHAEEEDMLMLIKFLADNLGGLLYRDLFGVLRAEAGEWPYEAYKTLHDLAAVMCLYESGCRAGELCNLSAHRLNKAMQQPAPTYAIVAYGKTNDRTYHVTEATAELYRLWIEKRPFSFTWAFCSWHRGGEPKKLSTPTLGQLMARRCHQAGIRPFRPHSMRHAKVIRARKIVGLEITSKLIDHANIQTTRSYDFIDEEEMGVAAKLTGYTGKLW